MIELHKYISVFLSVLMIANSSVAAFATETENVPTQEEYVNIIETTINIKGKTKHAAPIYPIVSTLSPITNSIGIIAAGREIHPPTIQMRLQKR